METRVKLTKKQKEGLVRLLKDLVPTFGLRVRVVDAVANYISETVTQ
ncbi:hypothetical protein LCGC14_2902030 [marine sediment metagenome]|uniref:Uncharacterized protein n=1 Tax=marine sediment metagenome TaxID=412755 RepID=A0A0F8XUI5_9ZZZZ